MPWWISVAKNCLGSHIVWGVTVKRWFGYKPHLIADTTHELPIGSTVLPANHNGVPVIDIRNPWKDPDATRLVTGPEDATYDWKGAVRWVCPAMLKDREMAFGGFEKDRDTLKYRCLARSSYRW